MDENAVLLERLRAVVSAAVIYRMHMLGDIAPVQACGMDLDEALSDLNEIECNRDLIAPEES